MTLLREIRCGLELTVSEISRELGISRKSVRRWEDHDKIPSDIAILYLNILPEGNKHVSTLKEVIKNNWTYDEDISPISNEVRRIRNGLGETTVGLSRLLGHYDNYWAQLEHHGRPLSTRDFEVLDKTYNISSTTIKRHNIIVEREHDGFQIPETFKVENPEIEEPVDLYDGQQRITDPETYLELIRQIEDENGGSVLNASVEDPKMIRLRKVMGVIYYDEEDDE